MRVHRCTRLTICSRRSTWMWMLSPSAHERTVGDGQEGAHVHSRDTRRSHHPKAADHPWASHRDAADDGALVGVDLGASIDCDVFGKRSRCRTSRCTPLSAGDLTY